MFSKYRGENIYSTEFQASSQRILGAFAMLIETADDPDALRVLLGNVKADQAEMGIRPVFYEAIRDGLLEALPKYLKNHFDQDAWMDCLTELFENLK
jgi:hemoglobin-like flavoprotein